MKIKALTDADAADLESFKTREWKVADDEHYGDTPPDFTEKTVTLLAKEEDAIVGQIRFVVTQGVAKVDSLLVGKDSQGNGVGKKLVEQAEQVARKAGAHKISLETGSTWSAKGFYEKLGYTVRATLPNDVLIKILS